MGRELTYFIYLTYVKYKKKLCLSAFFVEYKAKLLKEIFMEISTGMYAFFIITSIIGVGIGFLFSVEDLGKKMEDFFKEETKK